MERLVMGGDMEEVMEAMERSLTLERYVVLRDPYILLV